MSSDDNDRTKLRVRGAPPPATPMPPSPAPAPVMPQPLQEPARWQAPPPAPPPVRSAPPVGPAPEGLYRAAAAVNPLLEAALPLLMLATKLRSAAQVPNVEALQRRIAEEIQRFENAAREAQSGPEEVRAAHYALCATLDESVLNTPWGAHSAWASQTLLILFHREAFGGEKFFQILERIAPEPARYANLMELMYACLAIGFEGRYRLDARGPARLMEIQRDLYERIRSFRGAAPRDLSLSWAGVKDTRPRLVRYVPLWIVATVAFAVITLGYVGFHTALGTKSEPINAALAGIGVDPMYVPGGAPAAGPKLADLLAPEVRAGRLEISELGTKTIIRLAQPDMFASARATANPAINPTLQAVAAAVNKVPGRLLVIGHTDDQPLRSLQYSDNYELSRARAQAVADILRPLLNRPGIEAVGKGSDQPVATPVDRPENRARNRRVEIVHQAGL